MGPRLFETLRALGRMIVASPQYEEWLRRGLNELLEEDVDAMEDAARTKKWRNSASVPPKK